MNRKNQQTIKAHWMENTTHRTTHRPVEGGCPGKGRGEIVDRGAKALSNLLFALEWRWVPMDHWLENELRTLEDPTHAGSLVVEALKIGSPAPLREALNGLEDRLASEGVPRTESRRKLFFELIHPSRAKDMAIHGVF